MIRLNNIDSYEDFFDDIEAELNRSDDMEIAARLSQQEEMTSEFYDMLEKDFFKN